MSLTSDLSRQLDIRFIDARNLLNQAKLNLEIHGYVQDEHSNQQIQDEALRLFHERNGSEQLEMKQANWSLEAAKISTSSSSLSSSSDSRSSSDIDTSIHSSSCSTASSNNSDLSHFPMFMSEESSCSWWGNSVRCLRMPSVNQAAS
eukprot:Nitzschia sp. Nitz4//scaffold130_size63480//46915//47355//NITZ4_006256-RA/size63480-processed-gene-0.94-mRNA-1//-1//CDS//3329535210//1406//frame0